MSTQVTLTIPNNVYQQAESIAQANDRPVVEILTETIVRAFPRLHINENRPAMQYEATAFKAMHSDLWKQHPYQFVAIYQGEAIDYDDELVLVERVNERHPDDVVLIRQVLPQPQKVLEFRSPRFINKQ